MVVLTRQLLLQRLFKKHLLYHLPNFQYVVFTAYDAKLFLDTGRVPKRYDVAVVVGVVVTVLEKMPKALLIRNGQLRNVAYAFVTTFPKDLPS